MKYRSYLIKIFRSALLIYVSICLFMWVFQRHLVFLPLKGIEKPEIYGLHNFKVLSLKSSDDLHIQAWYREAKKGYPTIIYFHGNGGNLGNRATYFNLLSEAGFGILALDYRGYGASEGDPSEEGFYQDSRALMDYAAKTLSLKPDRIIIYGESIGTGVAVQMASEYSSAALILQSPFTSMESLAGNRYPWLPVHLLLKDRFDSLTKISKVHAPILVFHGEEDVIVPIESGKTIFADATGPKEAIYFPEKGHNDMDLELLTKDLVIFSNKYGLIKG